MKWLFHILIITCLAVPARAGAQHYIGKHKSEVRKLMKENMKNLHEDNTTRNAVFNMVKYIDNRGNQTLTYFFSEQDTCLYSNWLCDYSMLNKVVSDLNEKYEQSAEDSWYYMHEGRKYTVTLTTGEWFFTIKTRAEKKQ